jgi:hypothetical protein
MVNAFNSLTNQYHYLRKLIQTLMVNFNDKLLKKKIPVHLVFIKAISCYLLYLIYLINDIFDE